MEEVIALKKVLEQIIDGQCEDTAHTILLLQRLHAIPVDRGMLTQSKIGRTVNFLRKNCKDRVVQMTAKELITKWQAFDTVASKPSKPVAAISVAAISVLQTPTVHVRGTVTITFGECAENHVGMQKLGELSKQGFSISNLEEAKFRFEARGFQCELIDVRQEAKLPLSITPEPMEAAILVIRNGAAALLDAADGVDKMRREQCALVWDTKAFMKGRVVNKHARHNLCFAPQSQVPDYEKGKGRIIAFDDVPFLEKARQTLPQFFGPKAENLYAEGNLYYDPAECGIGFHGDSERRIVVAMRLGASMPLHYQWFQRSQSIGERVKLMLHHGDVYAMSEKATGTDWHKKIEPTLRHAAGAKKFLQIK